MEVRSDTPDKKRELALKLKEILDNVGYDISAMDYDTLDVPDKPNRATFRYWFGKDGQWDSLKTKVKEWDMGEITWGKKEKVRTPEIIVKQKMINIVSLNDVHIPFQDDEAVNAAIDFCGKIQPDIIVSHEFNDAYALSRFNKDPDRLTGLQDELDETSRCFSTIRGACKKSRILHLQSNHTDRLKKYLWSQAPALKCLRCLDMNELLGLNKYEIEYLPYFIYRDFMWKHGNRVNKYSAYTAKNEFERENVSGTSGHTHRLGIHYRTTRGGYYLWMESGCLCSLNPEYMEGALPDWQHGVGLVQFKGDSNHFFATPIPIIDGEILWGIS